MSEPHYKRVGATIPVAVGDFFIAWSLSHKPEYIAEVLTRKLPYFGMYIRGHMYNPSWRDFSSRHVVRR